MAELGDAPSVALTTNPDILAELKGRAPVVVGFAAETEDVERHAAEKLRQKGCDLIVANDVSEAGSGFGTDTNRVVLLARDGSVERLPLLNKEEVAERILDRARALLGPAEAVA
jgi:phosphopantothenoylcysteine decarboxylase/phosphopantothenate--cysteine ligase